MSTIKTLVNDASVTDFLNQIEDTEKRQDALHLLDLYTETTGESAKMWGTSIVGFGQYHYKSERSQQEADWMLAGFSPRKQNLTLYFMDGFDKYQSQLEKLGKHKTSKSCLYINKLSDVDTKILKNIVHKSYQTMKSTYLLK